MFLLHIFYCFVFSMLNLDNETFCAFPKYESREDPLILTPLIRNGDIHKALEFSKVSPNIGNVTSYSGFLTVNETCSSNLFFWFFPAMMKDWKEAPLILWLQGGPGWSSMIGVFQQIGPFEIKDGKLIDRPFAWNIENNVLAIDQPVGDGFSFSDGDCYVQSSIEAANELYIALVQFFELFTDLQGNRFIIAGESMAGHYIPALGHVIHRKNQFSNIKINLSAMIICSGWIDPISQIDYGSLLYQLGLVDDLVRDKYKQSKDRFVKEVSDMDWLEAFYTRSYMLTDLFERFVGNNISVFNNLKPDITEDIFKNEYLNKPETRKAIHVGEVSYSGYSKKVFIHFLFDLVQSVKPYVEELLEIYPIVFVNGQLDITCGYPMMVNFLRSLTWSGKSRYLNATRNKWCVDKVLAGYYKKANNLYEVLVRAAGHSLPSDQSLWMYHLVNSVTSGVPDNLTHGLSICVATN